MQDILNLLFHTIGVVSIHILLLISIHEAGHLFFGYLTGYRFLVFRIWKAALVKSDKRFRFVFVRKPDSFAQCIMYPKYNDRVPNPKPMLAGGIIFNLFFSILYGAFGIPHIHSIYFIPYIMLSFLHFLCAVLNICISDETSDGMSVLLMKTEADIRCFNNQLMIAAGLIKGSCYHEMPEELFQMDGITEHSGIYEKELAVYNYYRQLELGEFHMAEGLLIELDASCKTGWLMRELCKEKLFFKHLFKMHYKRMDTMFYSPNDMRLHHIKIDEDAIERFRNYIYLGEIKSAMMIQRHLCIKQSFIDELLLVRRLKLLGFTEGK